MRNKHWYSLLSRQCKFQEFRRNLLFSSQTIAFSYNNLNELVGNFLPYKKRLYYYYTTFVKAPSYCALYRILFTERACCISHVSTYIHLLPVAYYSLTNIGVVIFNTKAMQATGSSHVAMEDSVGYNYPSRPDQP